LPSVLSVLGSFIPCSYRFMGAAKNISALTMPSALLRKA
jgi:hypothetical protein